MNTPQDTPLLYRSILGSPPEPLKTQDRPKPSKSIRQWAEEGLSLIDKPTKQNRPKGKPINGYDRLNALVRIPKIQKEMEAIEKEIDKKKKIELWSRFFENYKVLPEELKYPKRCKYKHYPDFNTIHTFSNFEKSDLNFISKYGDGKHIIIAVDMSKKRQDITKEFDKILTRINKGYKIPKDRSRNRDGTIETKTQSFDHWEIYNLHKREGLTFVEIARKKWPDRAQKSGGDSHSLKNECMTVSRAYTKAKTIIDQIQKDLELNTKKEKKDYHKNHS